MNTKKLLHKAEKILASAVVVAMVMPAPISLAEIDCGPVLAKVGRALAQIEAERSASNIVMESVKSGQRDMSEVTRAAYAAHVKELEGPAGTGNPTSIELATRAGYADDVVKGSLRAERRRLEEEVGRGNNTKQAELDAATRALAYYESKGTPWEAEAAARLHASEVKGALPLSANPTTMRGVRNVQEAQRLSDLRASFLVSAENGQEAAWNRYVTAQRTMNPSRAEDLASYTSPADRKAAVLRDEERYHRNNAVRAEVKLAALKDVPDSDPVKMAVKKAQDDSIAKAAAARSDNAFKAASTSPDFAKADKTARQQRLKAVADARRDRLEAAIDAEPKLQGISLEDRTTGSVASITNRGDMSKIFAKIESQIKKGEKSKTDGAYIAHGKTSIQEQAERAKLAEQKQILAEIDSQGLGTRADASLGADASAADRKKAIISQKEEMAKSAPAADAERIKAELAALNSKESKLEDLLEQEKKLGLEGKLVANNGKATELGEKILSDTKTMAKANEAAHDIEKEWRELGVNGSIRLRDEAGELSPLGRALAGEGGSDLRKSISSHIGAKPGAKNTPVEMGKLRSKYMGQVIGFYGNPANKDLLKSLGIDVSKLTDKDLSKMDSYQRFTAMVGDLSDSDKAKVLKAFSDSLRIGEIKEVDKVADGLKDFHAILDMAPGTSRGSDAAIANAVLEAKGGAAFRDSAKAHENRALAQVLGVAGEDRGPLEARILKDAAGTEGRSLAASKKPADVLKALGADFEKEERATLGKFAQSFDLSGDQLDKLARNFPAKVTDPDGRAILTDALERAAKYKADGLELAKSKAVAEILEESGIKKGTEMFKEMQASLTKCLI